MPGHTLRLQREQLWEEFIRWAFGAVVLCIGLAVQLSQIKGAETTVSVWVAVLVFGLSSGLCTVAALRKLRAQRPLHLGLLGEQAMAEELQPLAAQGYRVFHDIPGDGKWNIDHVAVGPAGVFAIETKCRAKRASPNGMRAQDAVFDGKAIRFPWYQDHQSVEQAQRNAKWLAGMLSKATGEKVSAQALVALPGWWVTLKANCDVKVLSGKQVAGFIVNQPTRLPDKVLQQIAYQLDQRCRDVEF
ncbi:MAG TPA: nuclease-related domain-containing protein [Verrucomicrobiae bacterium]|nr:nuclease-related domain-containing protein [Verrucomicrobiae bacterium]